MTENHKFYYRSSSVEWRKEPFKFTLRLDAHWDVMNINWKSFLNNNILQWRTFPQRNIIPILDISECNICYRWICLQSSTQLVLGTDSLYAAWIKKLTEHSLIERDHGQKSMNEVNLINHDYMVAIRRIFCSRNSKICRGRK